MEWGEKREGGGKGGRRGEGGGERKKGRNSQKIHAQTRANRETNGGRECILKRTQMQQSVLSGPL